MNEFTDKEKEALVKFRKQLTDFNLEGDWNEDWFLIKWLRARDLSISKADYMLRENIKWRKKYNIDDIENWQAPEVFAQIFPMILCGFSKKGCPVIICPSKYFDINEFWAKCEPLDHMLYGTQSMERLKKLMKEKSTPENPVTEAVCIHDLDGFNIRSIMSRAYMQRMQETSAQFTDNYPEFIHKAYFLNAPRIFATLFSVFKHILPKKTMEKFEIHGYDKEKWIPALLEHVDPEVLPPRYGGTNEEFEKTAFAGLVTATERQAESVHRNSIDDRFTHVKVPAGKKHKIEYDIEAPKSVLRWSFRTYDYDISFALVYESEEIIPNARVDSAKRKQDGEIICEKTGKYSLVFDNTYSRMRSKSLHFYVEVEDLNMTDLQFDEKIHQNGFGTTTAVAETT